MLDLANVVDRIRHHQSVELIFHARPSVTQRFYVQNFEVIPHCAIVTVLRTIDCLFRSVMAALASAIQRA